KEDSEIWTIVENLDKQVEFRLDDGNVLWKDTRLVVPNDASRRKALLIEAHSSPFSVHPGYHRLRGDMMPFGLLWIVLPSRHILFLSARIILLDQVKERVIEGPEMIEVTNAKVAIAKEKLKEA
nr:putative reverse transcriptase domain-containing protein [Tanacetum cinerariifolium]